MDPKANRDHPARVGHPRWPAPGVGGMLRQPLATAWANRARR